MPHLLTNGCKFTNYNLRFRCTLCHLKTISSLPALPNVYSLTTSVENNLAVLLWEYANNSSPRGKRSWRKGYNKRWRTGDTPLLFCRLGALRVAPDMGTSMLVFLSRPGKHDAHAGVSNGWVCDMLRASIYAPTAALCCAAPKCPRFSFGFSRLNRKQSFRCGVTGKEQSRARCFWLSLPAASLLAFVPLQVFSKWF